MHCRGDQPGPRPCVRVGDRAQHRDFGIDRVVGRPGGEQLLERQRALARKAAPLAGLLSEPVRRWRRDGRVGKLQGAEPTGVDRAHARHCAARPEEMQGINAHPTVVGGASGHHRHGIWQRFQGAEGHELELDGHAKLPRQLAQGAETVRHQRQVWIIARAQHTGDAKLGTGLEHRAERGHIERTIKADLLDLAHGDAGVGDAAPAGAHALITNAHGKFLTARHRGPRAQIDRREPGRRCQRNEIGRGDLEKTQGCEAEAGEHCDIRWHSR